MRYIINTMKTVNAIMVNSMDNCVTLTGATDSGDTVRIFTDGDVRNITAREHVPIWHKMAIAPVKQGHEVLKYGSVIGIAQKDIGPGEHIHIHNLTSPRIGG